MHFENCMQYPLNAGAVKDWLVGSLPPYRLSTALWLVYQIYLCLRHIHGCSSLFMISSMWSVRKMIFHSWENVYFQLSEEMFPESTQATQWMFPSAEVARAHNFYVQFYNNFYVQFCNLAIHEFCNWLLVIRQSISYAHAPIRASLTGWGSPPPR